MKAGGTTVAVVGDYEGGFLTVGPGCTATIRPEGAYQPARYVVAPGEAAGVLWKKISREKTNLPYKIINQRIRNSLLQGALSPKIKVVRGSFR